MIVRNRLSLAVHAALGLTSSVFFMSGMVHAQDEPVLEEVHVTGTRITRANLISSSPITQIDSEDLLLSGITRVEDFLKNLPQIYSGQNSSVANFATGTATINLRNLGSQRTLVLVDGRRLPSGSPYTAGSADINQIPGALIERVEVLTGGASATYGSDAMAGVVNFYLVEDFQGVKLDYQFSQYAHDNNNNMMQGLLDERGYAAPSGTSRDGDTSDVALIIGGNLEGGRGNVTMYATYRDIDAVVQADRIHSACYVNGSQGDYFCGGSGTIAEGRFTDFDLLPIFEGVPGFDFKVQGDQFVPTGSTRYNFAPDNYFQRPDERWTAGAMGHYRVNEHVEAYTQLMYTDDRTVSQIAPSGAFFVTDSLSCGNPFLSDQQFDALCGDYGLGPEDRQLVYIGRRNVEGGPRRDDLRHTSYRGVFGLRGELDEIWRYDVYGQYAEVTMQQTYHNDMLISRISRALDATTDPDTGEPTCVSVLNGSDPSCVPWNIFQEGGVTQAAIDYLSVPLFSRGTTDQTVVSGFVAANLDSYGIRSPFAETGVDFVLGAEYREENLDFNPDKNYRTGDGAGQGSPVLPLEGGIDVTEFYAELSVPLVEARPWADSLNLDLGYRYSDYSTGETTDTYKIAAAWSPVEQLRIRGSFQRAVRVPNIEELYDPQKTDFFGLGLALGEEEGDPCAGTSPARSFADCAATGVTAAQYGSIPAGGGGFYTSRTGGNPKLQSEESDTRSVGFLYWPDFVDGLSISVDWYEIEIDGAINGVEPQVSLARCLDTADPFFCDKIHRSATLGDLFITTGVGDDIGFIDATIDNISFLSTSGYDVVMDYSFEVGNLGSMTVHNILSYVDDWRVEQVAGESALNCAGQWGFVCDGVVPEVRNHLRLTWITPWDLTISGLWRHIDAVDATDSSFEEDLGSYDYLDLSALWEVNESLLLRAGINNVFDEEPPLAIGYIEGETNGNTLPGVYDALGQYWFAGVTVSF